MTLAAEQGTELVLQARGQDAEAALDALAELFGRGFDEMGITEPANESISGLIDGRDAMIPDRGKCTAAVRFDPRNTENIWWLA